MRPVSKRSLFSFEGAPVVKRSTIEEVVPLLVAAKADTYAVSDVRVQNGALSCRLTGSFACRTVTRPCHWL
jgi:hypothetical protein